MRKKCTTQWVLPLLVGLLLSCGQGEGEAQPAIKGLSPDAKKVVEYLLADWDQQYRSTSIPLAMVALGMEPNDDLRLEVGQHFRDNTNLANNLKWWGANNYIVSNDEKLVAKYLIKTKAESGSLPDLQATAAATGLPSDELNGRLAFMAKAGLLAKSNEQALGYTLADGYEKWGGPLRYNFHTVTVGDDKAFDVW